MNIYECSPRRNYKRLSGLVALLMAAALVCFLIPSVLGNMPYRWVLQLLGLICVGIVIYIATRYVGKFYIYAVRENDGEQFLTVTEVTNNGRTQITVCRIGLENIEDVCVLDRRNSTDKLMIDLLTKGGKKDPLVSYPGNYQRRKVFVYHPDFNAAQGCYVVATECGEGITVKLAVDGTLVEYLKSHMGGRRAEEQ